MAKRKPIAGVCERYSSPKRQYRSRAVAEFDANVLRSKHPEEWFVVFRCDRGSDGGCGFWHVGKE